MDVKVSNTSKTFIWLELKFSNMGIQLRNLGLASALDVGWMVAPPPPHAPTHPNLTPVKLRCNIVVSKHSSGIQCAIATSCWKSRSLKHFNIPGKHHRRSLLKHHESLLQHIKRKSLQHANNENNPWKHHGWEVNLLDGQIDDLENNHCNMHHESLFLSDISLLSVELFTETVNPMRRWWRREGARTQGGGEEEWGARGRRGGDGRMEKDEGGGPWE